MNSMISVVIPIYNVEKYLKECLESVINQTYSDLQIILVDDGSTDASGNICDQYADKDKRITVVHQNNQGAGAAKNSGLELVRGKFLSLIDGDDYLELDYYSTLLNYIENHGVDVAQCLFTNDYRNTKKDVRFDFINKKSRVLYSKNFLFEMLYDWKYAVFWNKLFRVSLLKDIRFPINRKIDDEFFTYKLICNAKKVGNISKVIYHYRMRKSSVMNDNSQYRLVSDRVDCFSERYQYVSDRFPELKTWYYKHLSEYIDHSIKQYESKDLLEYLRDKEKEYPLKSISTIQKVVLRSKLLRYSPQPATPKKTTLEYFE